VSLASGISGFLLDPFDFDRALSEQGGQGANGGQHWGEHCPYHTKSQRELGNGAPILANHNATNIPLMQQPFGVLK
jgi:hypothetical protein